MKAQRLRPSTILVDVSCDHQTALVSTPQNRCPWDSRACFPAAVFCHVIMRLHGTYAQALCLPCYWAARLPSACGWAESAPAKDWWHCARVHGGLCLCECASQFCASCFMQECPKLLWNSSWMRQLCLGFGIHLDSEHLRLCQGCVMLSQTVVQGRLVQCNEQFVPKLHLCTALC